MLASQRRLKILDIIQEDGHASVCFLSNLFKVSEGTIRQDLGQLEGQGFIAREHGGAFLKSIPELVRGLELFIQDNMEQKAAIGKKAAEFIHEGDSIILDSGTTTTEIAKNINKNIKLKVITNAINIALLLGSHYSFEIHLIGGEFKPPTLSVTGQKGAEFFKQIHVDKYFCSVAGISFAAGLTYMSMNDIFVKRAMIKSSEKIYLVADSSKIGKKAFITLDGIEVIDVLITDKGIDKNDIEMFLKKGIEVIIA